MTNRPNRTFTACAVAVLTASSTAAALVSTAGVASAKAKPLPPKVWTKISSGQGINISNQPRVVRWGSKLVVVWSRNTGPSTGSVFSRTLAATGTPIGGIATVADSWSSVPADPAPLLLGGVPTVAMGGLHSLDSSDPLNGPMVMFKATDAASWALQPGSLTKSASAYGDYGYGVVDDGTGQPVSAGAYSSTDHVTVHHGVDAAVPAAAPDQQVAGTGGDIDDVNAVKDRKTGTVYALWYTLTGNPAQQGIHGAQIYPAIGAPSPTAPRSTTKYDGVLTAVDPGQDIAAASPTTGGVWAAYKSGYPSPHTIVLWNLTTGRTLSFATSSEAQYITLSPGPGGRLWVSWVGGSTVYATRTNPSVTKIGVVRVVATPAISGESPTSQSADGTLGPLDTVINVVGKGDVTPANNVFSEIYSAHIYEGLRVSVSPAGISYAKGGTVTATVTDAGVPVPGVYVKIGGVAVKTSATGKASITIAKHAAKGRHTVSAYGTGWYAGTTTFSVH